MEIEKIIKDYLNALEKGNYEMMIKLFTEDAIVFSPLYGKIKAIDFYRELFKDTSKSKITLLNILKSDNKSVGAGHFLYDWLLKDGTPTSFECVDVFQFADDGRIKKLTIIYDTSKIRPSFERMKE
ncbi:MAG: nuclear transport factor 2 family protein [Candidatus Aenigmarchaeota archaeon]|nr:nuclear transport factor 2 family protein [Candidatus Aenigmarchaeota archaeon]NIP40824.1 nuclear transport factor 2 family protein [Candidatus Aenigmarchaeota archaeon]NIQ17938.1 nuclear transport factor 2 family protein [Candidatus Aenigmarchaeota archaeon]NIS73527.1 nuclear transport factor 2 family protein [Candidatus Aenigmarchaeota archaeon]